MIHFTCDQCQRDFAVDNSLAGKSGKCSWCGAPVTIPQPHAPGTRTDDERDPNLEAITTAPPAAGEYPDIRQHPESEPDEVDIRLRTSDADLTPGDWVLCVLCSGIGCIVGIVRLIQGRPNAGKMIGVSLVFVVIWNIVRFLISEMLRVPGF